MRSGEQDTSRAWGGPSVDRRTLLAGAGAGAALAASSAALAVEGAPGLDAIARARGLRFGSAVGFSAQRRDAASIQNPPYTDLLRRDCGLLVAENQMKWQATRPAVDRFQLGQFDAMVDWSVRHGMKMRGHTLLWHHVRWFPKWLNDHDFGAAPAREAERILTTHITTLAQRYGDRVYSYDVVNEAVDPDTGGYRETSLSRAMGGAEPVLDLAFRTARATAPHAELVYNDYMSWEQGNEKHRSGVLKLLEGLRKRDVPVDALGVQSHIGVFGETPSVTTLAASFTPTWRQFLNDVVGMGYRLVITEFDVRDRGLPADPAVRDRAVADYARAYLEVMVAYPQLRDILAWGMSDRYSWLQGFEPRADGKPTRGCPYDHRLRAKPLHEAIATVLRQAPARGDAA